MLQTHFQYRTAKLNLQLQASLTTMVYCKVQIVSCFLKDILVGYFLKGKFFWEGSRITLIVWSQKLSAFLEIMWSHKYRTCEVRLLLLPLHTPWQLRITKLSVFLIFKADKLGVECQSLCVSLAQRSCFSTGEIQTLMSVDASRVISLCANAHEIWR